MGPLLRTLWPNNTSVHRVHHHGNPTDPRCRCNERGNHYDHPISGRSVRLRSIGHRRRGARRLLGPGGPRGRRGHVLRSHLHRPRRRAHYGRIHHAELPRLAMDAMDHPHHGRALHRPRPPHHPRVLRPRDPPTPRQKPPLLHPELGPPR